MSVGGIISILAPPIGHQHRAPPPETRLADPRRADPVDAKAAEILPQQAPGGDDLFLLIIGERRGPDRAFARAALGTAERRVGKEWVSKGRSGWGPSQ